MAKNLTIKEGKLSPNFDGVNRLRTDGDGSRVYWVPKDERPLETLFVMENGTYTANEYGISDVTVSVMSYKMGEVDLDFDGIDDLTIGDMPQFTLTGMDPDMGGMMNVGIDGDGFLDFAPIPDETVEIQPTGKKVVRYESDVILATETHTHPISKNDPIPFGRSGSFLWCKSAIVVQADKYFDFHSYGEDAIVRRSAIDPQHGVYYQGKKYEHPLPDEILDKLAVLVEGNGKACMYMSTIARTHGDEVVLTDKDEYFTLNYYEDEGPYPYAFGLVETNGFDLSAPRNPRIQVFEGSNAEWTVSIDIRASQPYPCSNSVNIEGSIYRKMLLSEYYIRCIGTRRITVDASIWSMLNRKHVLTFTEDDYVQGRGILIASDGSYRLVERNADIESIAENSCLLVKLGKETVFVSVFLKTNFHDTYNEFVSEDYPYVTNEIRGAMPIEFESDIVVEILRISIPMSKTVYFGSVESAPKEIFEV